MPSMSRHKSWIFALSWVFGCYFQHFELFPLWTNFLFLFMTFLIMFFLFLSDFWLFCHHFIFCNFLFKGVIVLFGIFVNRYSLPVARVRVKKKKRKPKRESKIDNTTVFTMEFLKNLEVYFSHSKEEKKENTSVPESGNSLPAPKK